MSRASHHVREVCSPQTLGSGSRFLLGHSICFQIHLEDDQGVENQMLVSCFEFTLKVHDMLKALCKKRTASMAVLQHTRKLIHTKQ